MFNVKEKFLMKEIKEQRKRGNFTTTQELMLYTMLPMNESTQESILDFARLTMKNTDIKAYMKYLEKVENITSTLSKDDTKGNKKRTCKEKSISDRFESNDVMRMLGFQNVMETETMNKDFQTVVNTDMSLINKSSDLWMMAYDVLLLGYIYGKRAERSKRNR